MQTASWGGTGRSRSEPPKKIKKTKTKRCKVEQASKLWFRIIKSVKSVNRTKVVAVMVVDVARIWSSG